MILWPTTAEGKPKQTASTNRLIRLACGIKSQTSAAVLGMLANLPGVASPNQGAGRGAVCRVLGKKKRADLSLVSGSSTLVRHGRL